MGFSALWFGFRVWGSEFIGFRALAFMVSGFEFRGLGVRVWGLGFRVSGLGFRALGFRV